MEAEGRHCLKLAMTEPSAARSVRSRSCTPASDGLQRPASPHVRTTQPFPATHCKVTFLHGLHRVLVVAEVTRTQILPADALARRCRRLQATSLCWSTFRDSPLHMDAAHATQSVCINNSQLRQLLTASLYSEPAKTSGTRRLAFVIGHAPRGGSRSDPCKLHAGAAHRTRE